MVGASWQTKTKRMSRMSSPGHGNYTSFDRNQQYEEILTSSSNESSSWNRSTALSIDGGSRGKSDAPSQYYQSLDSTKGCAEFFHNKSSLYRFLWRLFKEKGVQNPVTDVTLVLDGQGSTRSPSTRVTGKSIAFIAKNLPQVARGSIRKACTIHGSCISCSEGSNHFKVSPTIDDEEYASLSDVEPDQPPTAASFEKYSQDPRQPEGHVSLEYEKPSEAPSPWEDSCTSIGQDSNTSIPPLPISKNNDSKKSPTSVMDVFRVKHINGFSLEQHLVDCSNLAKEPNCCNDEG